jgi:hypothetical protein
MALVLFQASDPAVPDRVQDILINDRNIVTVDAMWKQVTQGEEAIHFPDGALITLADKRKLKVAQTPREVQHLIRSGGGR